MKDRRGALRIDVTLVDEDFTVTALVLGPDDNPLIGGKTPKEEAIGEVFQKGQEDQGGAFVAALLKMRAGGPVPEAP